MENGVIEHLLYNNNITNQYFLGTFPADEIPKILDYPSSLVVNMDNSNKRGSHWVAMFIPNKKICYYFDSFGILPSNENITNFLNSFSKILISNFTYQSIITDVCGDYVMFFIYMCSLGYKPKKIKKILMAEDNPDLFVYNFVSKYIE